MGGGGEGPASPVSSVGLSGHSKAHGPEGLPAKSGEAPETGAGDSHEIPLLVSGKARGQKGAKGRVFRLNETLKF